MPSYGGYYPNNNFYIQDLQAMRDRIDSQMRQLQQQNQMQQQPLAQQPITQNFQIAPQQQIMSELEGSYAENVDEVKNKFVSKTGIFATKDFSTIWIKDTTGKIRTFRTDEIIELDEKDKEILMLRKQVGDLKEVIENANANTIRQSDTDFDGTDESKKSTRVSVRKQSNAK